MPRIVNRYDYLTKFVCESITDANKFKLLYKSEFQMEAVYKILYNWFFDNGYGYQQPFETLTKVEQDDINRPGEDKDFPEMVYVHKELAMGTEIWLRFRCQKIPKEFRNWGFEIDIDIHVLGLNDVETTINGKKVKMQKGEFELDANGVLLNDIGQKIKTHEYLGKPKWKNFFFKKIYKQRADDAEDALFAEVMDLQKTLKEYFKLSSPNPPVLTKFTNRRDE